MRSTLLATLLVSTIGPACAARTDTPQTSIQPPTVVAQTVTTESTFERDWWRQFEDRVLDGLINEALTANRDLQAALARVTAARELAGIARLAHLPSGGAVAGAARQQLSEREAGPNMPSRSLSAVHIGTEIAWEADVFGRLRDRTRAATADANAAAMDARAVQVAIVAQVADAYFELRGSERDLELIHAMRERTRELIARTAVLVAAGRVTRLDTLRAQQIDDALVGEQVIVRHAGERARLRLATLTGRTGEDWGIPALAVSPLRVSLLPIGSMADVIRRRPDIAAADMRVHAASARTGAARADLFPRVEFSGSVGLIAGSVGQLAEASALSWLIAPRIAWHFAELPHMRRQLRAAGALTDAAFAEYEQTLLVALEEVRVAVDGYGAASERLLAEERRRDAASGAASILTIQYHEGLVDSLSRTLAERDAIAGALSASRALTEHRQAVVNVYRTLGGGWR